MKYDLLIKGGKIVDPSQGLNAQRDLALSNGKVASIQEHIDPIQCRETIDASGMIVSPGLIDMHIHAYWGASTYGIDPDISNISTGVTTALDAGSAGSLTFPAFRKHVIERSDTKLYALLNISATGMLSSKIGEVEDMKWADVDEVINSGRENREYVIGVKARLAKHILGDSDDVEILSRAIEAAEGFGGFVMIHIGNNPTSLNSLMDKLRPGDVITHSFHGFEDGVLEESGTVLEGMKEVQKRGVFIDIGHGAGSFSFRAARRALENGLLPDTISTDISTISIEGPVYDLLTTMSKMMHLGMTLDQVVERSTYIPARAMRLDHRIGTLRIGSDGDVVIMRLQDGVFTMHDRLSTMTKLGSAKKWEIGTSIEASSRLFHEHTVSDGRLYRPWLK